MNIWNFWAKRYHRLWVQKYSLRPTRQYILSLFKENRDTNRILDLGCGPGELIEALFRQNMNLDITGLDFSEGMLKISKERNPKAKHILLDVANLDVLDEKFHKIISTHSLPYYKDPRKVMANLYRILENNGKVFIGFASGNSLYDKMILSMVKLTTGFANYPSDSEFRGLVSPYFEIEHMEIIKEKFFMPRIAVYTLKKVQQ